MMEETAATKKLVIDKNSNLLTLYTHLNWLRESDLLHRYAGLASSDFFVVFY